MIRMQNFTNEAINAVIYSLIAGPILCRLKIIDQNQYRLLLATY